MLLSLDDDVVDVDVYVPADLWLEALLHAALEGGACVLQVERHCRVTIGPKRGDEGGHEPVGWVQLDLVVAGIGIQKGQQVAAGRGTNHLIYLWQGDRVLGTCLIRLV